MIFFLYLNTAYLWQYYLGTWDMLITLILLAVFFILGICWLYQLYLLIRAKFADRARLYTFIILTVVLGLTVLFPTGINYENWEGEDWVVAQHEGAANCTTTFRFKANKKFTEESVCFGVSRNRGTYTIKNDTIFLSYKRQDEYNYLYGQIKPDTLYAKHLKRDLLFMFGKGKNQAEVPFVISALKDKKQAD